MKLRVIMIWHMLRAGFHWNSMVAKLERTGLTHNALTYVDPNYRRSCDRYNESIQILVEGGEYITARSLMKAKVSNVQPLFTEKKA